MSELPLVSVITVCRNSIATLAHAIDSVLGQSYRPIEYVIVDGASTDGTLDVIKGYESKFRSEKLQFRWKSEPDGGIYDAMNKGITMTSGSIIGILNSDDFYEPDTVRAVSEASVQFPEVGIFYGFLRVLMNDGQELQILRYRYENYLLNLQSGVFAGTQHPTCFVRRAVYEQIGGFDTQFSIAADYDLLVRAMKAGVPFYAIDKVLCNFRKGGASERMSEFERLKQRYGIMFKNGLLTAEEYGRKQNELRYKKYKEFKQRLAHWLFHA
jgi:glycosyltransferase involved in cell wall biosynthesis